MPNKDTNIANLITGQGITTIRLSSADLKVTKRGVIYVKRDVKKKK